MFVGCACRSVCVCRMHAYACACRVCTCVQHAGPCGLENAHVHAKGLGMSVGVCLCLQGVHVHVHAGLARVCVNVWVAKCVHVCVHLATSPGVSAAEVMSPKWVCGRGAAGGWAASLLRLCQGEEAAPLPNVTCPPPGRLP